MPLISILTVTYNSEKYIRQTIESVLAQTSHDYEHVICDDCSTDNTWSIIQEYADRGITAYRNEKNLREYGNRSNAVKLATGKYVIFIDGDDVIYPNAVETFQYYIERFPECGMIFTREWDPRILYPFKADPITMYRFEYLDGGIMGGNFTKVLFRKDVLVEAGFFPTNIATGDTYIQLKVGLKHSGLAINDGLTWWRRRKGNASENFFKTNRHLVETINYRISFLEDPACPLDEEEIHIAKNNIYGLYLRGLVRLIVKLKWSDLSYLLKNIKIPARYYSALFVPSSNNYFNKHNGDTPLHTPVSFKSILNTLS